MTILKRALIVAAGVAAVAVAAADISGGNRRRFSAPMLRLSVLAALLIAGLSGLTLSASARGISGGSMSNSGSVRLGSSGAGRMTAAPTPRVNLLRPRTMDSMHRSESHGHHMFADDDFDRFRDHRRRVFTDGFFPFGFFGWSTAQPDLSAAADAGDDNADDRGPPFWSRFQRYERPSVEKTESGVTIIRGPGSGHF